MTRVVLPVFLGLLLLVGAIVFVVSRDDPAPEPSTAGSEPRTPRPDDDPAAALPADGYVDSVGANVHLHYEDTAYGNFSMLKRGLAEAGIRYVRDQSVDNGLATPDSEEIDEDQRERFADLYESHGIRVNMIFDLRYAERDSWQPKAEALGPALAAAEGVNEVDVGSSLDAAIEQQAWLHEDMNADPDTADVPVLGPSWVEWNESRSDTIRARVAPHSDRGNFHPYSWKQRDDQPGDPGWRIGEAITDWTHAYDGRPLVATEEGWPTSDTPRGETETVQAKYASRTFLENYSRGVERTFWYEFLDQSDDSSDDEHNFGFVRSDGSRKPSFHAIKNLNDLLADPGESFTPDRLDYEVGGNADGVGRLLLQKRDGTFYLVLWNRLGDGPYGRSTDRDVYRNVTVTLDAPADITTYLTNQSLTPTGQHHDTTSVALSVPDHPLVLRIDPD